MRIYKHWVLLSGYLNKDQQIKGYKEIMRSQRENGYKITHYRRTYGFIFDEIFLVEAEHNYQDLDLDIDSFSSPLKHLRQKPKDIKQGTRTFEEKYDYIMKDITA